jgi:hypothetical protein
MQALAWGTLHPDYTKDRKITWTQKELFFIGKWVETALSMGIPSYGVVSKCRQAIAREYPEMVPYFHKNHILDGSKFQYGYDRYIEVSSKKASK